MPDTTTGLAHPPGNEAHGAQYIAPDAHGQNFYAIDRQFQDLMSLYMEPGLLKQMTPHFERLGALAGNRLLYLDGLPIATYAAGEVQFLEKLTPKDEWEARNAVLRRHVPAALVPLDEV